MARNFFQTTLQIIYPARCLTCSTFVETDFGLCGECWRETQFVGGTTCDTCSLPLMGGLGEGIAYCDDCIVSPRPWKHGRSALLYTGNGRKIVLGLKHGDRHDIVRPASLWMASTARNIITPNMLVVPVPLHWSRLLTRRYNQAALLAQGVAKNLGLRWHPDALKRMKRTQPLKGLNREERFELLKDAIQPRKSHRHQMIGRSVLLVDDVMTSGATLAASTLACLAAGANDVSILTLARAVKNRTQ